MNDIINTLKEFITIKELQSNINSNVWCQYESLQDILSDFNQYLKDNTEQEDIIIYGC